MKRRLRLGKRTGFSGNYYGFSENNEFSHETTSSYSMIAFSEFKLRNSLNLVYGIQRKIGRVGYFDLSTGYGMAYTHEYIKYETVSIFDNSGLVYRFDPPPPKKTQVLSGNIVARLAFGIGF